ncbi:MAG: serine hydrolase domain-containing protein [Planctomycetota bacterium]
MILWHAIFTATAILASGHRAPIQESITLEPEVSRRASLAAGQEHRYHVAMEPNQVAIVALSRDRLGTEQEMNYLVTVTDPAGRVCEEVDTADGASFCYFRSRVPGDHSLLVRRWNGHREGTYSIRLLERSDAAATVHERIDRLLEPFYRDDRPGAAVAAVVDGEPIYARGFGLASLEHVRPITRNTRFELASCSKQFTGYAVAMLCEQGVWEPGDDVRTFLPELPEQAHVVTIRHLVHHLSGIYDYEPALELAGYPRDGDDQLSFERILRTIYAQPGTYFVPGSAHRYSNSGYVLLADAIARVANEPFGTWMEENVLLPAGMSGSFVRDDGRAVHDGVARSYERTTPSDEFTGPRPEYATRPNYLQALGAAHVHASIDDMIRWSIHSRDGKVGGEGAARRFRRGILRDPQDNDYLHGLATSIHRGMKREFHQGLSMGFRTGYYDYPDAKTTIIYLANDGEWRTYYLAEKVAEIVLDGALDPYVEPRQLEPPSAPDRSDAQASTPPPPTADELDALCGVYANASLGVAYTVESTDGGLRLSSIRTRPIRLEPLGDSTFESSHWAFQRVSFEDSGAAMEIRSDSEGRAFVFDRIGTKR